MGKIIIVIQARMGSTRLPGKVMRKLNDKTILEHIVFRMKKVNNVNDIYVATSNLEENECIVDFCKQREISLFVGDEKNVLSRFIEIIKKTNCDIIVRVTADNPLTDPKMIDMMINSHFENKADYTFVTNLPIGVSAEIVSSKKLLGLIEENLNEEDLEHVTIYLKKHPEKYLINYITAPIDSSYSQYSLTIDNEDEFLKIEKIFKKCGDDIDYIDAIRSINKDED